MSATPPSKTCDVASMVALPRAVDDAVDLGDRAAYEGLDDGEAHAVERVVDARRLRGVPVDVDAVPLQRARHDVHASVAAVLLVDAGARDESSRPWPRTSLAAHDPHAGRPRDRRCGRRASSTGVPVRSRSFTCPVSAPRRFIGSGRGASSRSATSSSRRRVPCERPARRAYPRAGSAREHEAAHVPASCAPSSVPARRPPALALARSLSSNLSVATTLCPSQRASSIPSTGRVLPANVRRLLHSRDRLRARRARRSGARSSPPRSACSERLSAQVGPREAAREVARRHAAGRRRLRRSRAHRWRSPSTGFAPVIQATSGTRALASALRGCRSRPMSARRLRSRRSLRRSPRESRHRCRPGASTCRRD